MSDEIRLDYIDASLLASLTTGFEDTVRRLVDDAYIREGFFRGERN